MQKAVSWVSARTAGETQGAVSLVCGGPGLYVGDAFGRRQCRRDLAVPEGLDDRADLEARRHLCGPEHER